MIHDTEWMDVPSDDMDLDQARQAVRELRKKVIELSNHHETVTEFADRCRECGAKYGKLLKQQPYEDAISRQAAIDAIWDGINMDIYTREVKECLEALPSVTPQQKIGRWIHREDMDYLDKNKVVHNHFMCQDCGFIHDFIDGHTAQYKYCPHCGAKMLEVEE